MNSPESTPNEEVTRPVIIGVGEHIILDENVKLIEFSLPNDLQGVWPEGLSTEFTVEKGKIFWILKEVNCNKEEDDLMVFRHRKTKEIDAKSFLETDMMRGEKEKKIAIAAAASAATLAATGATFLIVHKRKK